MNTRFIKQTIIVGSWTFIGLLLQFGREMLLAFIYGTSQTADNFYLASAIPMILFGAFASSSSVVLIPKFRAIANMAPGERREAMGSLTTLVVSIVLISLVISALLLFTSTAVSQLVVQGTAQSQPVAELLAWMSPSIFFSAISAILVAKFYSTDRLAVAGSSRAIQNGAFAFFLVLLVGIGFRNAAGISLSIATLLQTIVLLCFGLTSLRRRHLDESVRYFRKSKGTLIQFWVPFSIFAARQTSRILERSVASLFAVGSVASLNYAYQIAFVAVSIVNYGIGIAFLNEMSSAVAANDRSATNLLFWSTMRLTTLVSIPISILLLILPGEIVQLVFARGAFTLEAVSQTASVLEVYALSVFFLMSVPVLMNLFFAQGNSGIPSIHMLIMMVVNFALIIFLSGYGPRGIAFATVVSGAISYVRLFWLSRVSVEISWVNVRGIAKIFSCGLVMYFTTSSIYTALVASERITSPVVALLTCGACGLVMFYLMTAITNVTEIRQINRVIVRGISDAVTVRSG